MVDRRMSIVMPVKNIIKLWTTINYACGFDQMVARVAITSRLHAAVELLGKDQLQIRKREPEIVVGFDHQSAQFGIFDLKKIKFSSLHMPSSILSFENSHVHRLFPLACPLFSSAAGLARRSALASAHRRRRQCKAQLWLDRF
jgi:hypothetical protein